MCSSLPADFLHAQQIGYNSAFREAWPSGLRHWS